MSGSGQRTHIAVRPDWLAKTTEAALDPGQPIVDAHHHLFDRPGWRYLFEDLLSDLDTAHDIRATVYVQGRAMLRTDGPEEMRAVGETEFANGVAAMSVSGRYGSVRVAAGIVGFADLRLGDAARPILEAHLAAAGGAAGRFRGVRHIAFWDADPLLVNAAYQPTEDMLDSADFRAGFAQLAPLGLSFDAWLLFHQLRRLARLARDFPETRIVVDHYGGIAGIGNYAGKREEVFRLWSRGIRELAQCPNVMVKLGGLGTSLAGLDFDKLPAAPNSTLLADAWRPYFETVVDAFGTSRCMFESNFPMDKGSYAYNIGWNAMKRLAGALDASQKDDLFWRSANDFYRLKLNLDRSVDEPPPGGAGR
ncbi:amidohydrolase family protein [Devosia sp. CN2-171]|uniref:amidohydrolase family protein n=1 Tax=Devosia sp. CN2-171 TaxID=3400909 RepID=UPI003BF77964